ncbi:hypothetical protein LguiA_021704 [Lonicera macranthoides]
MRWLLLQIQLLHSCGAYTSIVAIGSVELAAVGVSVSIFNLVLNLFNSSPQLLIVLVVSASLSFLPPSNLTLKDISYILDASEILSTMVLHAFCDAPKSRLEDFASGTRLVTVSYATMGIKV